MFRKLNPHSKKQQKANICTLIILEKKLKIRSTPLLVNIILDKFVSINTLEQNS